MKQQILFTLTGVVLIAMASTARAEDKIVSETLLKELQTLTNAMIDEKIKDGTPLPPNATAEQMKAQAVAQLKPFIMVTADEEARFKKGEFDDAGNKKRMDELVKLFADLNVELPKAAVMFIEEHKSGKLSGARLELAVRLNQAKADKVKQQMEKK